MTLLLVVLALTTAAGALWKAVDGRTRQVDPRDRAAVLAALGAEPGERATLLQFSSAFCAPCRATRRVLHDVAQIVPGVVHVEVDAEHHLDATRTFKVMRTPTTLVLDAEGRVATRFVGAVQSESILRTIVEDTVAESSAAGSS